MTHSESAKADCFPFKEQVRLGLVGLAFTTGLQEVAGTPEKHKQKQGTTPKIVSSENSYGTICFPENKENTQSLWSFLHKCF